MFALVNARDMFSIDALLELKPYGEILFYLKLIAKEDKAQKKDIDRVLNRGMGFDFFPGLFHFITPMNVIKHKDGVVIGLR